MFQIYLSPSTQQNNYYVNGGTEEQYMNLLCDRIVPYLDANGIGFTRNDPSTSAAAAIRQANSGNYDLYLALHSNAAPDGMYGQKRGIDAYYDNRSHNGHRAARIFVQQLKHAYPLPTLVRTIATSSLGEVNRTRAPAVLLELGFHDNLQDANWIKEDMNNISYSIAAGILQYFSLPMAMPRQPQQATVTLSFGSLNIRAYPAADSRILVSVPNGSRLTVLGALDHWYVVRYGGVTGYAASRFVKPV